MNNSKAEIGSRIKKIRLSQGLTQHDLAERIGVTEKQISKIETGVHYPKFDNFIKILEALNITMREFASACDFESGNIRRNIMKVINKANEEDLQYFLLLIKNIERIKNKK